MEQYPSLYPNWNIWVMSWPHSSFVRFFQFTELQSVCVASLAVQDEETSPVTTTVSRSVGLSVCNMYDKCMGLVNPPKKPTAQTSTVGNKNGLVDFLTFYEWAITRLSGLNLAIQIKHYKFQALFTFHLGTALSMLQLYRFDCWSYERNFSHRHSVQLQHWWRGA